MNTEPKPTDNIDADFDTWYSKLVEWQSNHWEEKTTKYEDFIWIHENVIKPLFLLINSLTNDTRANKARNESSLRLPTQKRKRHSKIH